MTTSIPTASIRLPQSLSAPQPAQASQTASPIVKRLLAAKPGSPCRYMVGC